MSAKIPGHIQREISAFRKFVEGMKYIHEMYVLDALLAFNAGHDNYFVHGEKPLIVVGRAVRGAKNDKVRCVFRAHFDRTVKPAVLLGCTFVGASHYLHGHCIAAVHRDGGAATCLCGYETRTTFTRVKQVARVPHTSRKFSAYVGKTPIDPYRVYLHPSGIPFAMPQYDTPNDWLIERAYDKEFDYVP